MTPASLADLLEGEAAPEVGDHDFALVHRQRFQRGRRGLAVQPGVFRRGEPRRPAGGRLGFMPEASAGGAALLKAPLRTT